MRPTLATLLQQPESKTLEFKRDLSSPRNVLKTLVAFANTAGGTLLIGVDDDRRVLGLEQPLDVQEQLAGLIADTIRPGLMHALDLLTHDGRTVLAIEVFPSGIRPHYLRADGLEHGVYVRIGSSSQPADPALVAELQRSLSGQSFDELPMPELSVDDLDLPALHAWFPEVESLSTAWLQSLRLLTEDHGRLVPTRGAVLLFGRQRLQHFPDAWVHCGRFAGTDKAHIQEQVELQMYLPNSIEAAIAFLQKPAVMGHADQAPPPANRRLPLAMLRETLINAMVHADYSQRGAPIRVASFDDRIEIESPGILLPGMTVEDMRQGVSRLRNRVIARVFRELGLIDAWGSGVHRMLHEARALGLPEPGFAEMGMRLRTTIYLLPQGAAVDPG